MSENRNLKSITEVPILENLPEGAAVLINDGGAAKQIPAEKIIPERLMVTITVVPPVSEDSDMTFSSDRTYAEVKEAYDSGKNIVFVIKAEYDGKICENRTNMYNYINYPSGFWGDDFPEAIGFVIRSDIVGSILAGENGIARFNG